MRRTLFAIPLALFILVSLGLDSASSQKPENPGRPDENPSIERSQRPNQVEENKQEKDKNGVAYITSKNNKLQVMFENGQEDVATDGSEIEKEFGVENGNNSFRVRSHENASLVIRNNLAARTNFPLKVNLNTNELIVETPKGDKVVTVLPDRAVFNMLAANVLDQLGGKGGLQWLADQEVPLSTSSATLTPVSTPSATVTTMPSPAATPSGEVAETPEINPTEAKEENLKEESPIVLILDKEGNLVYEIKGIKAERFLGIFEVDIDKVVIVSAETGQLIEVKQNLANKILDLLSVE